jgi:hypothetical protein
VTDQFDAALREAVISSEPVTAGLAVVVKTVGCRSAIHDAITRGDRSDLSLLAATRTSDPNELLPVRAPRRSSVLVHSEIKKEA